MAAVRKIIHIDMDAFYAAVEQRDNPELRGKPLIVGGAPNSRGVVSTCSYEARKYGIHSAMPSSRAHQLCPHAIFIPPRFEVYTAVSRQIRQIFYEYTDLVEPLSLDEAFLDVTENKKGIPSATRVAREIKRQIFTRTGLTASAGVSYNKFIAKVASDLDKPDGLTVIPPDQGELFIERLPIRKFFGVGAVTEKKMLSLGIRTGADLKKWSKEALVRHFGKLGRYYFNIARGIDNRPVEPHRARKSIGCETTLAQDIDDTGQMIHILERLGRRLCDLLKKKQKWGRTVTLKVKYFDFKSITRSITLPEPVKEADTIMAHIRILLKRTEAGEKKVRLLGICISNFDEEEPESEGYRQVDLPLNF